MSRLYDTAAAEQVNNARFYVCRYHKMHNFHWYLCITVTHRRTTLRPHTTTDVGLPHMYVPQGTDNVCQTDGHKANSSIDKAADMVWCQKRPSLSLPMYLIYDTFIMLCASSRSFCPIWQENTETPMIVVVFAMQSHSAEDVRRTTATNVVEHNKKGNISLALYFNKYRHSRSINLGWQTLIGNSNTANELNNRRCAFVWFFISLSFCSFFFVAIVDVFCYYKQ